MKTCATPLRKRLKLLSDYLSMLLNFTKNSQRDFERPQSIFARDGSRLARRHRPEKSFDLQFEGFVFRDGERLKPYLLVAGDAERSSILPLVIE